MAVRKFTYLDPNDNGFVTEQDSTDSLSVAQLDIVLQAGNTVAINGGGGTASNFADPAVATDLATKNYVDTTTQGLSQKGTAQALADTQIPAATLMGGGLPVIDTYQTVEGDVVLLTNQGSTVQDARTSDVNNGLWVVHASTAWTRPANFAAGTHANRAFVFINNGPDYASTGWVCATPEPTDIIGTNPIQWSQFSGAGQITPGLGLLKSGNELSVGAGPGIASVTGEVEINLASNPGLMFDPTTQGLEAKPDNTRGIGVDSNGIYLEVGATNPGLMFDGTGSLEVKYAVGGGLLVDSNGLAVKVGSASELSTDVNGLHVLGVPADFMVAGVHVTDNVTATNLNTLTGGGVTTLHSHPVQGIVADSNRVSETDTAAGAIPAFSGVSIQTANTVSITNCLYANSAIARTVKGVTMAAASDGGSVTTVTKGVVPGALSGANAGDEYFLGATGQPVLFSALPSGKIFLIRLGVAKNSTDLDVDIKERGVRVG
jgi:hypothetical protein